MRAFVEVWLIGWALDTCITQYARHRRWHCSANREKYEALPDPGDRMGKVSMALVAFAFWWLWAWTVVEIVNDVFQAEHE